MLNIFNVLLEGGPVFMIPLFILILLTIVLFFMAINGKRDLQKTSQLIGHISLFSLIWGFLGSTIGLITAFDAIDGMGNVAQPMMAGGLKIALLSTMMGLITFLIGRVTMIFISLKSK